MAWADIVHEATRRPPSPPPGHTCSLTCFVYSPNAPSTNSPPVIAYISNNGDVRVRTIDLDWIKNPRIVAQKLLTSKILSRYDFEEVLRQCSRESTGSTQERCSAASQRLCEFQPAFDLQFFGRQMSDIYLVALQSGLEDDLWADPPEFNPTSFPSSCTVL